MGTSTRSPREWVTRLTRRAEAVRAKGPHATDEDFAELTAANEADWAALRGTPRRLAVCRELLRGYWDLSRLS